MTLPKTVPERGLPAPAFGDVQPGDIRYLDQNNDGVVNRRQDQVSIGRGRSPWTFSTNLRFEYKGFSLFVLGYRSKVGSRGICVNDDYY